MRSSILFLVVASVALVQTCVASSSYKMMTVSELLKRADASKDQNGVTPAEEEDYGKRIKLLAPDHKGSLNAKDDIDLYMKDKLGFYGLEITNRKSGDDDEKTFLAGEGKDFNSWPDGAYSQALWCIQSANNTMHAAMKACGPEDKCDKTFIINTVWGTLPGMDWKKDGVMLYHCVGYTVDKKKCTKPDKQVCQTTIVGDFHKSMWPAENTVNIIGNGATTISQITSELDAYSKAHGKKWSLPTSGGKDESKNKGKGKRSLPRRLNA